MPYQGEFANKASHFDIIKDPEVTQFLKECDYLKQPSDEEGQIMGACFEAPPSIENVQLPRQVIAIDGSNYPVSINEKLPSTEIGYVKIGSVLIDMAKFGSLRVGRFVDPFKVAELQEDNNALKFLLPSSNICWKGKSSVRDSFRAAVDDHLYSEKTRFNADDPQTSLRTTLFHLASRRPGDMGTSDPNTLKIYKCLECGTGPIELKDIPSPQNCPSCNVELYPSDCLRLWEEVNESQSNNSVLLRFMQVVEHLLPMHYVRHVVDHSLASLGSIAFFVDRPLAVFGTAAWLHGSIMRYLSEINSRLSKIQQPSVFIIGLQKTGQVVDHVSLIERFIQDNRIFAIKDDYRYHYIIPGRDPSQSGFGAETYYGQDFIYKTNSGRSFVFALPYPFDVKDSNSFHQSKIEIQRYENLSRAISLINHFECDLYENALIPIALANKYTAISLMPGGKVLDILTRETLSRNSQK
jgi:NurA domain